MFATQADLAARLARPLTAAEVPQAGLLIELATSMVAAAVGKTDAWAAALVPVPSVLRVITLEAVVRVMLNPTGARSESETLGAYSHSTSYETSGAGAVLGLALTQAEERRARRAIYGSNTASVRAGGLVDEPAVIARYGGGLYIDGAS